MLYEMTGDVVSGVTYRDDMTAALVRWEPGQEGYEGALAAYQAQEAAGYLTFAAPEGPFAAPWVYDLPEACPEGTKILVRVEAGEIFVADFEAVTLADPGSYAVQLLPPSPHRGFYCEIEVV